MIDFLKILKLYGFPVRTAQRSYREIEQRDDLHAWQLTQRAKLVEYHLKNNPFYKKHVGDSVDVWEKIPILRKADLQGDYQTKLPVSQRNYYILSTSGSSGHPLVIARDKLTHALVWLNVASHYHKAGVSLNDLQARFYGIPLSGISYYKERLKDYISNRRRFPVFDLSDAVLAKWLQKFQKTPFVYLYGYTNSLVAFAEYAIRQEVVLHDICPSIKACIITAEDCIDADKKILEKGFGVPVFNEFGASEVSVIGFKSEGYWEVSDELVYLEVVDDSGNLVPDGKKGRLLCTMLHNLGTPIIRYEIGDVASILRENGKTFITNLSGRLSDTVVLPSGRKIPGLTFYYVARQLLNDIKGINEFRIIQKGEVAFEMEVVAPLLAITTILPLVQAGFDKYLEPGLSVSIKKVKSIKRTGSGKFKHFIGLKH
jgi:phenylacetate-CoA ligase